MCSTWQLSFHARVIINWQATNESLINLRRLIFLLVAGIFLLYTGMQKETYALLRLLAFAFNIEWL